MSSAERLPQTHRLILVRHARSQVDPARPPASWGLATEGEAAAGRLAALALFGHAAGFYAGPEPKMVQTLAPVTAEWNQAVTTDPAFGETHAEGWFDDAAFRATVRRLFEAPDTSPAAGWETAAAAIDRFSAGVARLQAQHQPVMHPGHALPGTVAIASGGRMLIAYLAHVLGYRPLQAFDLWQALRMPDVAVLELAAESPPRLVIPFGTLTV